ncbi:uncharacterized protein LOC144322502 isoform X3 [Canis aureus]
MAFDSPQEVTVISLLFAHWMGMCSSASGILLASSSSEYCPGIWPVSQDSRSACHSTDPPGWTRGKNEQLLVESEPTASKHQCRGKKRSKGGAFAEWRHGQGNA